MVVATQTARTASKIEGVDARPVARGEMTQARMVPLAFSLAAHRIVWLEAG